MPLLGEAPYGDVPYADFDTDNALSIADALDTLLEEPWQERSWWLRAKPRDKDTSTDPPTLLDFNVSTDGHRTFPTDAEEIQLAEALIAPYSLEFSLPEKLWGFAETTFGEIRIGDPDLGLRSFAGEDWVGRQADVYVGPRGGIQVQFARVAQLLSRQLRYNRPEMVLIVDDYGFVFDAELQTNVYAGTGGLEGGTELQGRPKPVLLGIARQFQPVLVDGTNRVYQIHDGAMASVIEVLDQGVALVFDADVADITTATPASGEYATSLATGYIKLGSDPNGVVTCSATGHNSSSYGYVNDIEGLTKLLAVTFAGLDDPSELDTGAFTTLSTHTAELGEWIATKTPIRDVLERFLRSAGAWAWLRPNKVLTVGRLSDPDSATADFSIDSTKDELRLEPFEVVPFEIPVYRVLVGYRRYSRTMSETDLDSTIGLAARKDYAEEYRFTESEDATVLVQTPEAREIVILTQLDDEADAQALGDEQLALRKTPRYLATVSPRTGLIKRGVGDVFELTEARQHTSPKKWFIVGVENAAEMSGEEDRIVWECFG